MSFNVAARSPAIRVATLAACALVLGATACAARASRTPITARAEQLRMSPQELRIRVRALIRPTLGTVEEVADAIGRNSDAAVVRRGARILKIETTGTLLATMLRDDPVMALADAWGYAFQVEAFVTRPETIRTYGPATAEVAVAMGRIRSMFRELWDDAVREGAGDRFEAFARNWAAGNPIEGALYRRSSMDASVADVLASADAGGALAALESLQETTDDLIGRMDLYTLYLPRLARWEAEVAVDDLARGVEPKEIAAELERFTRSVERVAAAVETAPDVVARERGAAFAALGAERRALVEALREERVATLAEVEAAAQRLLDRSGTAVHDSMRGELEVLVRDVEGMRERLIGDAEKSLERVVDHAFVRALQLLLVAAFLVAGGVVLHARFLRR